MHLANSVIIISGASTGIGAALARKFAQKGAHLILIARRADALIALKQQLERPDAHRCVIGDIGNRDTIDQALSTALTMFGRVDMVVCNAGIGLSAPVASISVADMQECINTNIYGVLHMIQASLPVMRSRGSGRIVVVSSVVGVQGLPYSGGYCATKGAIERLCDALRIELLGSGIALNVVRPGTVTSEFGHHRRGSQGEQRSGRIRGISPDMAAQRMIEGIVHNKRYIYTRWQDRILLWGSQLIAPIADRVLAQSITWRE